MISMSGVETIVATTSTQRPMQTHIMLQEASSLLILAGCWYVSTQMSLKKEASLTSVTSRQMVLLCSREGNHFYMKLH